MVVWRALDVWLRLAKFLDTMDSLRISYRNLATAENILTHAHKWHRTKDKFIHTHTLCSFAYLMNDSHGYCTHKTKIKQTMTKKKDENTAKAHDSSLYAAK